MNEDEKQEKNGPAEDPSKDQLDETVAELLDDGEGTVVIEDDQGLDQDPVISLQAEIDDLKDRLLRAVAETENTRRRAERDRQEAQKYGGVKLARDMVSVADNLERALGFVDDEMRSKAGDFIAGMEATLRELESVFGRHQIKKAGAIGEKFDPKLHQAMVEIPTSDMEPGHVVQVMQQGYIMEERLLRPAMVGVSKAPPQEDEVSLEENTSDS
ncbi:MAG TPA: nucleotide exchange factor GrpE [Alphaproteobacteria bacterium]|nr:nucleotide exchange factor GrpE [Paracoccaceae bacterium]RCL81589.1 MAG: nucleotide exchange factor GrpE [SAR116 cluster bacterium]RPH13513.1 MAG: nucleotide exchange factor GrpE [Alphaproteobacteria bacterium TMED150]HBQ22726.1 nucleotide exchange factor GrpE [Alphaproteobacteria bacterium]HCJ62553.1 nucleotide exchange factor GrpE [Alphaproteobacteria bacterium]